MSTPLSIAWVCNHSRNTQLALLRGHIDLALTFERDQEELAAREGWSTTVGCVFHDHFVLVGPQSDPAEVRACRSIEAAFVKIRAAKALFHSRADFSATMWKERGIWQRCGGVSPWDEAEAEAQQDDWYKQSLYTPSEALVRADAAGAYLLSDRSTLLRQVALCTVSRSTVFVEPRSPTDELMNTCYALTSPKSSPEKRKLVDQFLSYTLSLRGQNVIAKYGLADVGI